MADCACVQSDIPKWVLRIFSILPSKFFFRFPKPINMAISSPIPFCPVLWCLEQTFYLNMPRGVSIRSLFSQERTGIYFKQNFQVDNDSEQSMAILWSDNFIEFTIYIYSSLNCTLQSYLGSLSRQNISATSSRFGGKSSYASFFNLQSFQRKPCIFL